MHSLERIEKQIKSSPEIAETIKDINANINGRYLHKMTSIRSFSPKERRGLFL